MLKRQRRTNRDIIMNARKSLIYYSNLADEIDKNIDRSKYTYNIHDNDYFEKSFSAKPNELLRIYWEEILQRAHWAGLSSLIRNLKWIKGTVSGIQDNNLLAFTANLRCLIESSGDNLLTLLSVPKTLADNYKLISTALQNRIENNKMLVSKELEEILIHFSYARIISEQEKKIQGKMPKYQNAKPASEYLKRLDRKVDNGPISELYSILCQFAHPAAHSIHYLFRMDFNDNEYRFTYSDNSDSEYIERILKQYNDEIIDSLNYGFNPGIITLKTLNLFDFNLTKTPYIDNINTDSMKVWTDIIQKVRNRN